MLIKRVIAVALILTSILTGCSAQSTVATTLKQSNELSDCSDNLINGDGIMEIRVGESIYDVRKQAQNIVMDYFSLLAFRESDHSIIVIACGEYITGIAEFSKEGILLSSSGLVPIEMPKTDEVIGLTIDEVVDTYGEIHTDLGSGQYVPTYVTNRGTVIALSLEDNVIISAIENDIRTGTEMCFGDVHQIEVGQ